MRLLILQAKNKSWNKVKDLFFKAAKDKGIELSCAYLKDLNLVKDKKVNLYIGIDNTNKRPYCSSKRSASRTVAGKASRLFRCYTGIARKIKSNDFLYRKNLAGFDVIYLRFIGRFLEEASLVGEYCRQKNILLFDRVYKNGRDFDRKSFECLRLTHAGVFYPKTFIGNRQFLLEKASELEFPLILKKTKGRKAEGVYKVKSLGSLKRLLRSYEKKDRLMIQEYIDNDFYLRLMVVGGQVIGAMKRNKSMGSGQRVKSEDYNVTKEQEDLAIKGAKALNIDIAGIDMMVDKNGKNYILEVNRSPQYITFMKKTNINVPEKIVEFFKTFTSGVEASFFSPQG